MLRCRQCVETTDGPARTTAPMHMSLVDLPYKHTKLQLRKELDTPGPEYYQVNRGHHRMPGYSGHTHGEQVLKQIGLDLRQHIFAKTYGSLTRELRRFPSEPSTSAKYIQYAENRPLVTDGFELKHAMKFHHNKLMDVGEGTLGPSLEPVALN
uniref:Uncharacterized protein n=1 Tax=Physcomitrium patens TaxID=3218 RepID=A0A2K1KIQ9_PHYPA|nr:hypothetical protein PHYPA_007333 [Physcomitrium patens]